MTYSFNEVEATAKKAVRGAGYPWGVAEDASKAVRFLCQTGLDGCKALAGLLTELDGTDAVALSPDFQDGVWSAQGQGLCPIMAGIAAADRAQDIATVAFKAVDVIQPLLMLPFAASVARQLTSVVSVRCGSCSAVTDGTRIAVTGVFPDRCGLVVISNAGAMQAPLAPKTRAVPAATDWHTLNRFAHRTYAPATEESRRKGAG